MNSEVCLILFDSLKIWSASWIISIFVSILMVLHYIAQNYCDQFLIYTGNCLVWILCFSVLLRLKLQVPANSLALASASWVAGITSVWFMSYFNMGILQHVVIGKGCSVSRCSLHDLCLAVSRTVAENTASGRQHRPLATGAAFLLSSPQWIWLIVSRRCFHCILPIK